MLTLGPEAAVEQLWDSLALGIDRAVLLETDGREWDAGATAGAIVEAVQADSEAGMVYDLILFGNESADSGGYQVGVGVAHALGLPCVTGVKALEIRDQTAVARREASGGWEVFELPLPAAVTVKEGINLPRYPSIPGRLKAKRASIERRAPEWTGNRLSKVRLRLPEEREKHVEILGHGPEAVPRALAVLRELELV